MHVPRSRTPDKYDSWYLMEPDSRPIKKYWFDDLILEIALSAPFALLGSKYDGFAWDDFGKDLPLVLLHHINGNAVYNHTDPLLLRFLQEFKEEKHGIYNAIPFDLRISQIIMEGSLGYAFPFVFDESVELPEASAKVAKYKRWWNELTADYVPVKESQVISNQSSTLFTPDMTEGASVVHGKNNRLLWDHNEHGVSRCYNFFVLSFSPSNDPYYY